MKLKDIIKQTNWQNVSSTFLSLYPDQINLIEAYKETFIKLCKKRPTDSKMVIYIKNIVSEGNIEIYGTDGSTREDGNLEHFSLSLSPWSQWLGSRISNKILENFTIDEIIAHWLFDMTFYGFTESKIKSFGKELRQRVANLENPVRYIILSNIFRRKSLRMYFNISEEYWSSDINSATTFKNRNHAAKILDELKGNKQDNTNILAKISIVNNIRKVLKYYE